jgi:hypothetical protein
MHPLAAVVPGVEVPRSDVVAARIARKVGPLFGVPWEQNPFGRTWVCDFGAITLAEIARGAPYPPRDAQAALDAAQGAASGGEGDPAEAGSCWRPVGRAVWTPGRGPTPSAIAHATLNRFGPDTKSAVVLTGANRLLLDITAAIASVCGHLANCRVTPEVRLAVWAGLVLEAFRGQPALVAAAIQARTIQRALTTPWGEHLLAPGLSESARCEFGSAQSGPPSGAATGPTAERRRPKAAGTALEPTGLDLIDATLPLLELPLPVTDGPLLSQADLLDDIANRWCRRLLQIGHPGRGITWVSEVKPGHRRVQSYLRIGSAVAPFVTEVLALLGIPHGPMFDLGQIIALIADDNLAAHPVLTRRARLITAHVLANYLRFNDDLLRGQPEARAATCALTGAAADLAARHLGPRDPVSLLLTAYTAYCAAWDLGRDKATKTHSGPSSPDPGRVHAQRHLAAQLDDLSASWRGGDIDPGTASYLLEIGVMALGRLSVPGDALATYWREAMLARGVDPAIDLDSPLGLPGAQQYHLQNYAAFLASQATDMAGLRRALAAQQACAAIRELVAEGERAEYRSKFTSVRTSHQAAAAIIGRMLTLPGAAAAGDLADADRQALIAEGMRHVQAALANPATAAMIDGNDPEVIGLALAVLPVTAAAPELMRDADLLEIEVLPENLHVDARRLLSAALGQAERLGPALPERDHAALADLSARLGAAVGQPG